MSAITHLFAGVPVSDLDAGLDWYTRFFGRPPDSRKDRLPFWQFGARRGLEHHGVAHPPISPS